MEKANFGKLILATSLSFSSTGLLANETKRDLRAERKEQLPDRSANPISTLITDLVNKLGDFTVTEECDRCQSGTKILN